MHAQKDCPFKNLRRVKASPPYQYKESGLDNVFITGHVVLICAECEEEFMGLIHIDELHREIAHSLRRLRRPWTEAEARFILTVSELDPWFPTAHPHTQASNEVYSGEPERVDLEFLDGAWRLK